MNGIHKDAYAIGTQHEQVTGRIKDMLIELQNHAYATGVERGKALAKQAAIEAGTISPALCQTIHLGQPGVTVEPCLMLGPDEEEVACLLFTAPGTEVRLTWPTQTQALAVLAAATAEDCIEADAQPVACECGDSYPPGSYGAGFIEGRGHCANCAAGAGEMASLLGVSPAPVRRVEQEVAPDRAELLRLVELLGSIAGAAFRAADDSYEDLGDDGAPVISCGVDQMAALRDALDACDSEPEIDDAYVRDGWLTVLDKLRAAIAAPQHALTAVPLAAKHQGMRISAGGVLRRVKGDLKFGAITLLEHLEQMAELFYSGDLTAVDTFLQLYDLDEKRPEQQTEGAQR